MYKMLKKYKSYLTKQQYKTIKGQLIAGDFAGAEKGLKRLVKRNEERIKKDRKYERKKRKGNKD